MLRAGAPKGGSWGWSLGGAHRVGPKGEGPAHRGHCKVLVDAPGRGTKAHHTGTRPTQQNVSRRIGGVSRHILRFALCGADFPWITTPAQGSKTAMVILFNKPMNVLSQFTSEGGWPGLAEYIDLPGVYAAGRLDRDSEGLLVLTDDGKLQARITQPKAKLPKTYWVQVEGVPDAAALAALRAGVTLKDGRTRPAKVRAIPPPQIWDRDPPVRMRKTVPDRWLELTITEGRNRQVRRMVAAVGTPCLRLVRVAVGSWRLDGLPPGAWRQAEL